MADAVTTGDENHGNGTKLRHEQGIVIGAADHFLERQLELAASAGDGFNQSGSTQGRGVQIDALDLKINGAPATDGRN